MAHSDLAADPGSNLGLHLIQLHQVDPQPVPKSGVTPVPGSSNSAVHADVQIFFLVKKRRRRIPVAQRPMLVKHTDTQEKHHPGDRS